jgi:hypothetical protein
MTATELMKHNLGVADVSSASNATDLIKNYSDWEGAKVLNILMQYPNTPVYSSVLETALNQNIPLTEAQAAIYHLAPIKMTDEATLKAVKKRLNQLIAQQANTPSPHHSVTSSLHHPIQDEIHSLTQYLKETTLPTGGIKCFHDEDRAAYRRQSAAIRRLLAKAIKDGHHEAVAYIKHHLFQGKQMRWEE